MSNNGLAFENTPSTDRILTVTAVNEQTNKGGGGGTFSLTGFKMSILISVETSICEIEDRQEN